MPLTEAGIYAAALRLIDADGVEALTMRKLATAVDANPMSLYHHVPNKDCAADATAVPFPGRPPSAGRLQRDLPRPPAREAGRGSALRMKLCLPPPIPPSCARCAGTLSASVAAVPAPWCAAPATALMPGDTYIA